jgi:D-sedoheptulose 7-phosphate isomerase
MTASLAIKERAAWCRDELLLRNRIVESFFTVEAPRLAAVCHEMSRRFTNGGRLLAFGNGAAATDAEHISVEFVHPVIVGKRALPALDVGSEFSARLPVILQPGDIVVGFAFPDSDGTVDAAVATARSLGGLTLGLTAGTAEFVFSLPDVHAFVQQEVFEVLYHMLWETVHVYFEHREQGHEIGASSFLYPFLGRQEQNLDAVVGEVQLSMLQKMHEVNQVRAKSAETESESLAVIAAEVAARIERGGKVICFGNGGSATDANDLAIDCVVPPISLRPIPAVSLSSEPAEITAIANDVGAEAIFVRLLIAHAQQDDVAIGISTSGSSPNILRALEEARRRGMLTIGVSGYGGGRVIAEGLADFNIVVRSDYIPRIQEVQASLYHILRQMIDEHFRH